MQRLSQYMALQLCLCSQGIFISSGHHFLTEYLTMVLNIYDVIRAQGSYVHYVLCLCLQDRVCCGENADQLVHFPPLQISEGNSLIFCLKAHHDIITINFLQAPYTPSIVLTIQFRFAWSLHQLQPTLDRSRVQHRANTKRQLTLHAHIHTCS